MDEVKLSKQLSYMLRHRPEEYGLDMDEQGWVDVQQLLEALRLADTAWQELTIEHIQQLIANSPRRRHELKDGKIRALYGHTTSQKIRLPVAEPPPILYHGTSRRSLPRIRRQGLLPMKRQYVHLAREPETAIAVGRRKDDRPIVLHVASRSAYNDGIKFYYATGEIWLADHIPAKYIRW